MSNFQRGQSKVWWGDSPPNIGSPVAHASNQQDTRRTPGNDEWEPQLPHWAGQDLPLDTSSSPDLPLQWIHRRSSPASHKSQDSGFSDSDSSPPNSHHENNDRQKPSVDSNSVKDVNENSVVKEPSYCQTPRTFSSRHNSRLVENPGDLEKLIENHCQNGHIEMEIDTVDVNKPNTPNNINLNSTPVDKCTPKKTFSESHDITSVIEDKPKDMPVKSVQNDNLELIRMTDNNQIAVNNQPRMRSPVSNVYQPDAFAGFKRIHFELDGRSEVAGKICTEKYFFQRTRLHKSLNLEHKVNKDSEIQVTNVSLDYSRNHEECKENLIENPEKIIAVKEDQQSKFSVKYLTDTLHLKNKKSIQRKTRTKIKSNILSFLPLKNSSKCPDNLAGGTCENGRVPSLGLPRCEDTSEWVVVGLPESEKLVENYTEMLVCDKRTKEKRKIDKTTSPSSKSSPLRKITPPPQFQDRNIDMASHPKIEKTKPTFDRSKSVPNQMNAKGDSIAEQDGAIENQIKSDSLERINAFNLQIDVINASTPKITLPKMSAVGTPCNGASSKLKPVNLLKDFDKSAESDTKLNPNTSCRNVQNALQKISINQPGCVQQWLQDMTEMYEPECMATLQSKTISANLKARVSASSVTITGNIRKVQTHGQIVIHQYYDVIRELEMCGHCISGSAEGITSLIANINEFVITHSITLNTRPPGETPERWDKITDVLKTNIQKIVDISDDVKLELNESNPEKNVLIKNLDSLLEIFLETAKAVLIQQMKTLVSIIEEPPSDVIIKSTLTSISHLGVSLVPENDNIQSENCLDKLKDLTDLPFVECGVPRALLTAIIESNKSSITALSLRALTTICVTSDAVKQFEEGGGIEILSDILAVESNPEPQMREAVTVLTQVTAPWLKGRYDIKQLDAYLDSIIKNVTGLMSRTQCCQLLLLCTACIGNLLRVFLHLESPVYSNTSYEYKNDIILTIIKHRTVEMLLEAVKNRGPHVSIFLQEQTAHLLCILSQVDKCSQHLASIPSVSVALTCFLQPMRGTPNKPNELQAEFRLVNKTTEALYRLCVSTDLSSQIVLLGGIQRLVKLVKSQQKYQNKKSSDQILINCLRTLRIINQNNPEAVLENMPNGDIKTMLEPSLMESVLLYSSKQESYV